MKTIFTKQDIFANRGCYSREQVEACSFINLPVINAEDLLRSEIPLKDKRWFVWNACALSLEQKKDLALKLAWVVLPIFEDKYPEDKRVRECLEAMEQFKKGLITREELLEKRRAAADAATDAADAAYAATDAADAAYAVYAADAAYAVYAATAYAASKTQTYSQKIQELMISFLNENKDESKEE